MGVSKNNGTPKSSILIGFSLIFTIHFGGFPPIFGNTHISKRQRVLQGATSRLVQGTGRCTVGLHPGLDGVLRRRGFHIQAEWRLVISCNYVGSFCFHWYLYDIDIYIYILWCFFERDMCVLTCIWIWKITTGFYNMIYTVEEELGPTIEPFFSQCFFHVFLV